MNKTAVARQAKTASFLPPAQGLLLQRKCACGNHTVAGGECAECAKNKTGLQRKLAIGASNDPLEQEADRAAEQVLAAPTHSAVSGAPPRIQRYARQAAEGAETAPASVDRVLAGSGRPLDPALRQDMEQRFGHDFSRVRVHSGAAAEQSARELNALAYTAGRDIVFDAGKFAPSTNDGRRLLAHELTHVVQQRGQRVASQMKLAVSTPGDAGEREADAAADAVMHGRSVPSIAPVFPGIQRKCHAAELGAPDPDCAPSQQGVVGWQFQFKVGCDDLLPGEEAKISKPKVGNQLKIHGFASQEGDAGFNADLSCHRANRIADMARKLRADCPVIGVFKHGASPVSAPGVVKDLNPPDFWRSVIIEEVTPPLESGEQWLDPSSTISKSWALYRRAQVNPTQPNLVLVWAWRSEIKDWLTSIGKTLAPQGAKLTRRNLDDYRRIYASAEQLWIASDQLLALHKYPDAAKDTYTEWAVGSGKDQGDKIHAKNVPTTAKYHVDIFGEGYFKGAINIGMAERTSTTGIYNSRVPNLIYRRFSSKDANALPIADHTADLVTSENGPIGYPGLAEEIARIIAPGGTIVLNNPVSEEAAHDKVAKATGGTIKKVHTSDGVETVETTIVVPGP
ncbi:MAG: DUF4157 domain-containing protein [Aquabacterium sp.]|nr:DUF4157 domain-containing protein [Aquabacterium sp.]